MTFKPNLLVIEYILYTEGFHQEIKRLFPLFQLLLLSSGWLQVRPDPSFLPSCSCLYLRPGTPTVSGPTGGAVVLWDPVVKTLRVHTFVHAKSLQLCLTL